MTELKDITEEEKDIIKDKEKQDEKKRRKRILLLLLLLLLLLFLSGLTIKYGKNILEFIQQQMGNYSISAPVITGGSEEWAKERLIKVEKDAVSEDEFSHYEYCVNQSKDTKKCTWKRTDTKNVKITTTGIYYVTFRGVDVNDKKGALSNQEVVYIDNVNPVIKDVKIREKTTTSISVEVQATDSHSGVSTYEYSLDGENYTTGKKIYTFENLEKDTGYIIYIRVTDKVGNVTILSMQITTPLTDEKCEINCDIDEDGKCDYNCDTDGDGDCDVNCDDDGDGDCDLNCDDDGDGECDRNCDTDGDGVCDTKCDEDEKCDLNCDTDGDGDCDLNCDTDDDGKCDINCDDDGDGDCDRNCDTDGDGDCDRNCDTDGDGVCDTKCDIDEEEWDVPIIHLNNVPTEFTYGSKYKLPSYVSFGNDTGTYACTVKGVEYKDTSTLGLGQHVIICTATSSHNVSISVSKVVNVIAPEDYEGEVWDGWIILTLYYPANSTDWEWRIGKEGEIREGYESGWQPYTGPILVKIDDVDDVYIRYKIDGEIKVEAPKGKVAVDIVPEKYEVKAGEKTKVEIYYEEGVTTKEYKVGSGDWQEYTGEFEVGPNTLIEARATKSEDVYDSKGNLVYTATIKGTDAVYIREPETTSPGSGENDGNGSGENEGSGSGGSGGNDGNGSGGNEGSGSGGTGGTGGGGSGGGTSSSYLKGPIITGNPASELTETVEITVTPQEEASKIYVSIGFGAYVEYTGPITVTNNCLIRAYYIRKSDGQVSSTSYYFVENITEKDKPHVKINTDPSSYLSEDVESVEVTITGSDYDTLEYSLDGVIYEPYTESLTITESTTVYAKGTNQYGSTIVSKIITTVNPPMIGDNLEISIHFNPEEKELTNVVNEVEVTIDYDEEAENKYYRIGNNGSWISYNGPFKVNKNTTIYAYATSSNGSGKAERRLDYLTTGISDPAIKISPTTATPVVLVEIEYDKNASIKKYSTDGINYKDYTGAFYIDENNTTIYAYNQNVLGHTGSSNLTITNIVADPYYKFLDLGQYYLIRLNYPETSKFREYKWKKDGVWKEYDPQGILLIKSEYKDEIDASDGIRIVDENGKELIFTDHYYYVDVSWSEIRENIFMRWDVTKPDAPKITIEPTEITEKVQVIITYPSALVEKYYRVTNIETGYDSGWLEYTGPFEITDNNTTIHAKGMDSAEVWSDEVSYTITNIDNDNPVINKVEVTKIGTSKITVSVDATDKTSGVVNYSYSLDGENYTKTKDSTYTFSNLKENTKYTIYVKVEDALGHESEVYKVEATTKTIGAITFTVSPASGWATSKKLTINYPTDVYNGYVYEYSTDSGSTWKTYTGPLTLTVNNTTVIARVRDGNNGEKTATITVTQIDPTVPTISLSGVPSSFKFGASYKLPTSYTAGPSGATVSCKVNGVTYANTATIPAGTHTITCTVTTGAGASATASKSVTIASAKILYDTVAEQASLDTNISFSSISSSSNGLGVYTISSTANNTYPIHYYRGAVTNNHVIFAGFCWDIVRTTETGGVKLIYDGIPVNGTCPNTGSASHLSEKSAYNSTTPTNNSKYVGYMYDTSTNSTIKTYIDNWYASNMTKYTSYLEDTVWCNDRSVYKTSGSTVYYGAYGRLSQNKTPSLTCPQAADRYTVSTSNGNGLLTYPVGLITADEAAYAGAVNKSQNTSYYLRTTGQIFHTMTPYRYYSSYSREYRVEDDGAIEDNIVTSKTGVRPMVSLKPGIEYTSGNGTETSPYVIAQ